MRFPFWRKERLPVVTNEQTGGIEAVLLMVTSLNSQECISEPASREGDATQNKTHENLRPNTYTSRKFQIN
jgi:hypothetical protein